MATKKNPPQKPVAQETKAKPVRVDLSPGVHKALRRAAAEHDMSMAALARKIISEHLGAR